MYIRPFNVLLRSFIAQPAMKIQIYDFLLLLAPFLARRLRFLNEETYLKIGKRWGRFWLKQEVNYADNFIQPQLSIEKGYKPVNMD